MHPDGTRTYTLLEDPLLEEAIAFARRQGRITAPALHRRLTIPMPRAKGVLRTMEQRGLIGPADGRLGHPVYA